ncbi:hypothetical protein [Tellurirhabdus rosea]|uniref:hypothetical protein n=1 Tax=Tellurirhabdus rosea TaxID=2674997 RepID=UPI00225AA5FB|nr:hypothetical protein [Tellurirhabdus rosea]
MRAFIVRPFGVKEGVDFEAVHRDLIRPALKALNLEGDTTEPIIEAGNIREDMFFELMTADLVIADITVHNPNVFYELGARHALRNKRTFLIRGSAGADASMVLKDVPFDLKTDRYLSYPLAQPAAILEKLIEGLRHTIANERTDSPIFNLLPNLKPQDPEDLLAVPREFGEELAQAMVRQQRHHKIGRVALLAHEATGFSWEVPALRSVGEVLFKFKDYEDARRTYERIRERIPDDLQANELLATVYQRLSEQAPDRDEAGVLLTQSDQAIDRLLAQAGRLPARIIAEAYALKGRNAKTKLQLESRNSATEQALQVFRSDTLTKAYKEYELGYLEDLNHFYSGINALGLLTALITLAERYPDEWEDRFDTPEAAASTLSAHKRFRQDLAASIRMAIQAQKTRLERRQATDRWLDLTAADLACLTETNPRRVERLYANALRNAEAFYADSVRRQLQFYQLLSIVPENVQAALDTLPPLTPEAPKRRFILFTGHMIDRDDRPEPRFPASAEPMARQAIRQRLEEEKSRYPGHELTGIAAGACGGDLLFHEVCAELGIPTELFLPVPAEAFVESSVGFAGESWIRRFYDLYNRAPKQFLLNQKELPRWLVKKPAYNVWTRGNLWMLYTALSEGGQNLTLLALWDGQNGDGSGGTTHLVAEARRRGARPVIIDSRTALGLPVTS